jgi:hypothetical protein
MKNSIIVITATIALFASCKKAQDQTADAQTGTPVLANVSLAAGQQLARMQQDLNGTGSTKLKMLGYEKVGTIADEAAEAALLASMFGAQAKTVVGALNYPDQIKVVAEKEVARDVAQQEAFDKMKKHIADRAGVGTDILEVKWLVNGTAVEKTIALADANGIIWDNFMSNLPKFSVEEGQATSTYDAAARTQVFTAAPVSVRATVLGIQVAKATYNLQAVWDYNVKQYTSKIYSTPTEIGFGGNAAGRGNSFWPTTTKKTVQGYYAIAASTANVSFVFSGGSGGNTQWRVSFSGGSGQKSEGVKLINTPVNP